MSQFGDDVLHIYVDGSSLSKPRRGGVGVRFVWTDDGGNEMSEDYPIRYSYEGGRIGQMELKACIEALKTLIGKHPPVDPDLFRKVIIHTDSRYVAENYPNAKWGGWRERGWRTKDGAPVHNKTGWEDLVRLHKRLDREQHLRLEIDWIPGKSDEHTKAVDKMAKRAAESPLKARKLDHQRVRKKWSTHKAHRGGITLRGQEEIIRLVTDVPMTGHRNTFHYSYEVVDDGSADFQLVDYAYSDTMLGAGHIYRVRFNEDTRNPHILDAKEIERQSAAGRYIAISCGRKDPLGSPTAMPKSPGEDESRGEGFGIGERVGMKDKIGTVRSVARTSDGTSIYKVRWDGEDRDTYVIEEALQPST